MPDEIRLWRDPALGVSGVELLAGRCFEHRYRPHFHDEVVIAAFTGGAQRWHVGRHRGTALPGNVLIIHPGEMHTGEAAQESGWAYRAFYPDDATLRQLAADLFVGSPHRAVQFEPSPLHPEAALAQQLVALHRTIEAHTGDPLRRLEAFAAAMTTVLLHYARPVRTERRVQPEREAIRKAKECAAARFAEPSLGIDDLATAAGLSPYHFMRAFRTTVGVSVHGFVTQLRIQHARRLLANGTPAAEVACAAGFADQSHLIRHFRAALGVTPGQYARETRKRAGHAAAPGSVPTTAVRTE